MLWRITASVWLENLKLQKFNYYYFSLLILN